MTLPHPLPPHEIPRESQVERDRGEAARKRRLESVGKVPFEKAYDHLADRQGKLVMTLRPQPATPVDPAALEDAKRNARDYIDSHKDKSPNNPKLAPILRGLELVDRVRALPRKPHAVRLVAALAMEHTLDAQPWLRDIQAIKSLHGHSGKQIIIGSLSNLERSVRKELPSRVHTLLESLAQVASPRRLTGAVNAQAVQTPPATKNELIATMGLLELTGHAVRMPPKGNDTMWIHAIHRYSPATIPRWNDDYNVLKRLHEVGAVGLRQSDLHHPTTISEGRVVGSANGVATKDAVHVALNRLLGAGLIVRAQTPSGKFYRLTTPHDSGQIAGASGLELMERQSQTPFLIEALREKINSKPRPKEIIRKDPTNKLTTQLATLRQWAAWRTSIDAYRAAHPQARPYEGHSQIAREHGVTPDTIHHAADYYPWKKVDPTTILKIHVPLVRAENPVLADTIERHAKADLERRAQLAPGARAQKR